MGCNCVLTGNNTSETTVTGNVIWNGSSLHCISFSAGNVNDLVFAIATAICDLQGAISSITITSNETALIGINTNCLQLVDGQSLTAALNAMIAKICANTALLANLTTAEIDTIGIVTVPNCLGLTNGMTLTQMINQLINKLCKSIPVNPVNPWDPKSPDNNVTVGRMIQDDFSDIGAGKDPFISYIKSDFNYTDTSTGGIAKITFPAFDYYADDLNIIQPSEEVPLTSNADNYIYLDNTNQWEYNVSSVVIGNPIPTVSGTIVCKVETGTGTITTVTQIIARYPIDNTLLQNKCVKARNLYSDVVNPSGAIKQDGNGALENNVDGTTIQITSNELAVKTIYKANVDSSVAGTGLKQNVDLSLSPNVANSIVINSNALQLLNDISSGVNKDYGFDENGSLGYHDKEILTAVVEIPHESILTGYSIPIQIIAAQGAGIGVEVISTAVYTKTGWSTPYATNTTLQIITDTATLAQFQNATILTESSSKKIKVSPVYATGEANGTQIIDNKAVYVQVATGDPTRGVTGQTLKVYVTYKLLS